MGWSHPDISLEDLLNLIKGFVDIIILTSGYQSSGSSASWDSLNIKKALKWGIFFENVFKGLKSSDDYHGSVIELDEALLELTSNPYFPQGLKNLSSLTLARGKDFVLKHLIQTIPLRDEHLTAILVAVVEMDLDVLRGTEYDCLDAYLENLTLFNAFSKPQSSSSGSKTKETSIYNLSEFVIQELSERQTSMSCVSSVEVGLSVLSGSLAKNKKWVGSHIKLTEEKSRDDISLVRKELVIELDLWNKWRSRSLSYFLDRRTIKLVSGAKLIFSAPKVQWLQVFGRLDVKNDDDLIQIIEISLLGYVASRWSCVIEYFMSGSYDTLPISMQYHEVNKLLHEKPQSVHTKEEANSKESDILEYLAMLLSSQPHKLWKLSPVLVAIAIPSWSQLFRLYLTGVETLLKGYPYPTRCCSCTQNGEEHKDCELAERIWCLYIFHVQGAHLLPKTSSS